MSDEESLCSPLFERIRKLQERRRKCRIISNDALTESRLESPDRVTCEATRDDPSLSSSDTRLDNDQSHHSSNGALVSSAQQALDYATGSSSPLTSPQDVEALGANAPGFPSCENEIDHGLSGTISSKEPKFRYLRKGQGTARCNSKIFKGFKKTKSSFPKSVVANYNANRGQVSRETPAVDVSQKLNAFEKLEALVEHNSFCSTSSKVVQLVQASHCSSPFLRKGPLPSFPITPIAKDSPPIQELDDRAHMPENNPVGILRKRYPDMISPSDLKVQFLEQGVEVLEYDEDDPQEESTANETDLISVSDLENLALLNFNVNVVQKSGLRSALSANTFLPAFNSTPAIQNTASQSSCADIRRNVGSSNNEERKATESSSQRVTKLSESSHAEDFEVKSHKLLLLSKVDDLSKEINIFRNKNIALEKLVSELEKEKQNLIESQRERLNPPRKVEKPTLKKKMEVAVRNTSPRNDAVDVVVTKKLQDLSEKLLRLEIENKNLNRKLITLEKKEKEGLKRVNDPPATEQSSQVIPQENCRGCEGGTVESRCMKSVRGVISKIAQKNKNIPRQPARAKGKITSFKPAPLIATKTKNTCTNSPETSSEPAATGEEAKENEVIHVIEKPLTSRPQNEGFVVERSPSEASAKQNLGSLTDERHPLTQWNRGPPPWSPYNSDTSCEARIETYNISPYNRDSLSIVDVQAQDVTDIGSEERSCDTIPSVCHYPNGDKKTIFADKTVLHFAKDNIVHSVFQEDGMEEISFANGQKEIYFKDGSYQLIFPDSSSKSVYRDGSEVCVWKDGTVIRLNKDGTKSVHFPNGQKEIYEDGRVRRVYPDGTTKILHADGSQHTHYANGRIRFKDKDGNISLRKMVTKEVNKLAKHVE